MAQSSIIPLHRAVRLPARTLDDIVRDHGSEAQHKPDLFEQLRAEARRGPSTLERVSDALASPRFVLFYAGFYAGAMFTVGMALLWSVL